MKRASTPLGVPWIFYLRHLQVRYPFLFSLSVRTAPGFDLEAALVHARRTNPLDPDASVTIVA